MRISQIMNNRDMNHVSQSAAWQSINKVGLTKQVTGCKDISGDGRLLPRPHPVGSEGHLL